MSKKSNSKQYASEWNLLTAVTRLRPSRVKGRSDLDARTEFENDYDRVVFSSSFRRLRNKAQVFSLESHDFVRTRLTHSIEVSTIGRSLGEGAARAIAKKYALEISERDLGAIVATACLLHDLGNPPFGHSGEKAIGRWFDNNMDSGATLKISNKQERADLIEFEGNAHAFRIATRLQWTGQDFGMNLTAATLSTLLKYPCASSEVDKSKNGPKSKKKFGYFKSDSVTFQRVRTITGLSGYCRHPLTYLMEAADDIAYAVGDLEDVLKKGFVDYQSIRGCLESVKQVDSKQCVHKFLDYPYQHEFDKNLVARERQQLSLQRFCQMAIRWMMKSAIRAFVDQFEKIMEGKFNSDLVSSMEMSDLCGALKNIMVQHVYSHIEIANREQTARNVIAGLLSAIIEELRDRPTEPLSLYTYRSAPLNAGEISAQTNYDVAQRATDYVAGMTDGHALAQFQRIAGMRSSF